MDIDIEPERVKEPSILSWKEQENEQPPEINPNDSAYLIDVGQDDCSLLVVSPEPLSREQVLKTLEQENIPLYVKAEEVEIEDY